MNRRESWVKAVIIAFGIATCLFMILPYPFTSSPISCSEDSRTGITDCRTTVRTKWSWFGGYHATLERVVPMSSEAKESHASKYFGVTQTGIAKLALVSIALGFLSVLVYRKLRLSSSPEKSS